MKEIIKLSTYAKRMNIHYQTSFLWWKAGRIPGAFKTDSGSVMVEITPDTIPIVERVVVYARVSSHPKKDDLDRQVQRCLDYCSSKGYFVEKIYKEIASGMNDNRPKFWDMLNSSPTKIIVENKDRLTRFGFNYIDRLMTKLDCKVELLNSNTDDEQDLMKDMIAIITSFCCRLYGARRGQNKVKTIKATLNVSSDIEDSIEC